MAKRPPKSLQLLAHFASSKITKNCSDYYKPSKKNNSPKFENFLFNLNLKKGLFGSSFFRKCNKNLIKMNDNGLLQEFFQTNVL